MRFACKGTNFFVTLRTNYNINIWKELKGSYRESKGSYRDITLSIRNIIMLDIDYNQLNICPFNSHRKAINSRCNSPITPLK